MPDPNFMQQAGDFTMDAAIDNTVDGVVNQAMQAVASHIPGGEAVEQMFQTETDQVLNNAINNEINKGIGGVLQDAENLFHPG